MMRFAGRSTRQGLGHHVRQKSVHLPLVTKTDLVLGRMCIHIHARRVHLQKQHVGGLTCVMQHIAKALLDRMGHDLVADRTTIDEHVLPIRLGPSNGRLTQPAPEPQPRPVVVNLNGLFNESAANHIGNARRLAGDGVRRRIITNDATVVRQTEASPKAAERGAAQHAVDVPELRLLGAQELPPGGHVVKQIAHFDRRATRVGTGRRCHAVMKRAGHLPPAFIAGRGANLQPRHRSNAGQRLASEPQRGHTFQLIQRNNLAGRMRRHGQRNLRLGDAMPVITDA